MLQHAAAAGAERGAGRRAPGGRGRLDRLEPRPGGRPTGARRARRRRPRARRAARPRRGRACPPLSPTPAPSSSRSSQVSATRSPGRTAASAHRRRRRSPPPAWGARRRSGRPFRGGRRRTPGARRRCPARAAAPTKIRAPRSRLCSSRVPASTNSSFIRRSASACAATISIGSQAFQRFQTAQSISPGLDVERERHAARPARLGRVGARLGQHHHGGEVVAALLFAAPRSARRTPATPPRRRKVRAATGRSLSADSSKAMSPAWLATAAKSSGWRMASTSAPKPARRLAADGARLARGDGPIARVDRGNHLAHEVRLVVADAPASRGTARPPSG